MKNVTRIVLCVLLAAMILAAPFVVPSGAMLGDYMYDFMDYSWGLLPTACAEGEEVTYSLPIDFTPGMKPNPAAYTESSYIDASITVEVETLTENDVIWRIARIQIKDASQFRTGIAGNTVKSNRTSLPSVMAEKYNAVIAISSDYYVNDPAKTTYEYRMGQEIRDKRNRKKDILFIDENGDFHLFVKSDEAAMKAFDKSGLDILHAFTFGPALVKDGTLLEMDKKYGYNPNEGEPRMAIGQLDTLSYVLVLAEGRLPNAAFKNVTSVGVTHQELADFMYDLGCLQAYNLDGGNTATMIFNSDYYQYKTTGSERPQSDIIYFATAVDPATWSE